MEGHRFDDLTRNLANSTLRRQVLRALGGMALGGLLSPLGSFINRTKPVYAASKEPVVSLNPHGTGTLLAWAATDPLYVTLHSSLSTEGFAQGRQPSAALVQSAEGISGVLVTPYESRNVSNITADLVYTLELPPDSRVNPAGPKPSDLQHASNSDANAVVVKDGTPLFTLHARATGHFEKQPVIFDHSEDAANCRFCKDICSFTSSLSTPGVEGVCDQIAAAVAYACVASGVAAEAFPLCLLVTKLACQGGPQICKLCDLICDFHCPPGYQECPDKCVPPICSSCADFLDICGPLGGPYICADLASDPQHCGACNNACLPDEICVTDASSNIPHCSFSGPEPCGFTPCAPDQFCCRGSIVNACCPVGSDCCSTGG